MSATILFATGGSETAGFGHVRRCLSLAQAFDHAGVRSEFLIDGPEVLTRHVERCGFRVNGASQLTADGVVDRAADLRATAIVCDSYAFDSAFFNALASVDASTVVLDDLADRELPVHIVVNAALGAAKLPYRRSAATQFLLGPCYALLRPEFAQTPDARPPGPVRRVLISLGGSDPHGATGPLVEAVSRVDGIEHIDVVAGPLFKAAAESRESSGVRVVWHRSPDDMRSLMLACDIAVCAGGQTLYELAAAGVPSVAIRAFANQTNNLREFDRAEIVFSVGDIQDKGLAARVQSAIRALSIDADRRLAMSRRGRSMVDGHGAERVAAAVLRRRLS